MSEREYLYDGWLKIFRRHRNGRKYDILEAHSAVAAFLTDDLDRVLLVQQYRPAVEKMTWEIPAGVLDKPGKSPIEVLVEEIEEECAVHVAEEALSFLTSYIPQIGHNYSTLEIYTAKLPPSAETERTVDDVDVERVRWWTMEELGTAIREREIQDVKTVLAYYCHLANRRN